MTTTIDESQPIEPAAHEITIETYAMGTGERHRAVCSCGKYRSTSNRIMQDAQRAGWQHQRRMGSILGKPDSGSLSGNGAY